MSAGTINHDNDALNSTLIKSMLLLHKVKDADVHNEEEFCSMSTVSGAFITFMFT